MNIFPCSVTSSPLKPPSRRSHTLSAPRTIRRTVYASIFSTAVKSPPTMHSSPLRSPTRRAVSRLGLPKSAPVLFTPQASPVRVGPRIPLALQAVFLACNKGAEVTEAPTEAAMDFREPVYIYERVSQIAVRLMSKYIMNKISQATTFSVLFVVALSPAVFGRRTQGAWLFYGKNKRCRHWVLQRTNTATDRKL